MLNILLSALKQYKSCHGRTSRYCYWQFMATIMGILCLTNIIQYTLFRRVTGTTHQILSCGTAYQGPGANFIFVFIFALQVIMALLFFIPTISMTIRRFHDSNISGKTFTILALIFLLVPNGYLTFMLFNTSYMASWQISLYFFFIATCSLIFLIICTLHGNQHSNTYGTANNHHNPHFWLLYFFIWLTCSSINIFIWLALYLPRTC